MHMPTVRVGQHAYVWQCSHSWRHTCSHQRSQERCTCHTSLQFLQMHRQWCDQHTTYNSGKALGISNPGSTSTHMDANFDIYAVVPQPVVLLACRVSTAVLHENICSLGKPDCWGSLGQVRSSCFQVFEPSRVCWLTWEASTVCVALATALVNRHVALAAILQQAARGDLCAQVRRIYVVVPACLKKWNNSACNKAAYQVRAAQQQQHS